MVECDGLRQASRSRRMYDDEWVMSCLLEGLLVRMVDDRLLRQPLIKSSDDCVPHGILFQDVIDFSLGCTAQDLAFGRIEKRKDTLNAVSWGG